MSEADDAVSIRTTIDGSVGAERLVQSVLTFSTGASSQRRNEDLDEVAYVVSGTGSLILDGNTHQLHPDLGV
ncbi:MAG: hypothetical protein KY394_06220, partial [Actinobacteria bacterium]|nr:hypothetical protein [Actinomycetota bacterium]